MLNELSAKRFLFALLIGALLLVGKVFLPLAGALLLAAALAAVFWPLNLKLARRLGKKRGRQAAATIITFGVLIVILGPVIGLSAQLVKEIDEGLELIAEIARSEGLTGLLERLPGPLEDAARSLIERFVGDVENEKALESAVQERVAAQGQQAAGALGKLVSATGSALFLGLMMIIALFFLLQSGDRLVDWVDSVSPLRKGRTRELLGSVHEVASSVVKSEVLTATIQSGVALLGYVIARVPSPIFFTAVTFVIAFIPALGAGAVCLAAAGLLLLTGHPYMGVFLAIWALTAVALVDNVVRPWLIKEDVHLDGAVVFFALLGGLASFGAIGLLIGPLAVALLVSVIRVYRADFLGAPPQQVPSPSGRGSG